MARCIGSSQCNCVLVDGDQTIARGAGTTADPYRVDVSRQGLLVALDTPTIDLTLDGTGLVAHPYVLQADAHLNLGELDNVSGATPSTGYVLGWDGSQWLPVPPVTATPGLINVSGCLQGDGSSGLPLHVKVDPDGGLVCRGAGLGTAADYNANTRVNTRLTTSTADEVLDASHETFKIMPNGDHTYTAPAWATSCLIDYEVQAMHASTGPWAGSVGRLWVVRSSGSTHNPDFDDDGGIPMWSLRVSGAARGSSVGYREVRKLFDVVGGEDITLQSQMRATHVGGSGNTQALDTSTVIMSHVTWSDQV